MNILSAILATGGAALLLGAGALLRTVAAPALRAPGRRSDEAIPPPADPDSTIAALTSQLAESTAAQDWAREETIALRQRLERQVEAAEAEVRRVSAELEENHAKLATAEQETAAAHAKCEALERLIEGVRARSRELAEELKALKGS